MSERVPEGWTQSRVINFVNVGRGYAFKSFDYHSTGNPIVRVINISDSKCKKKATLGGYHGLALTRCYADEEQKENNLINYLEKLF